MFFGHNLKRSDMPLFSLSRTKRFLGRQKQASSTPDHTPKLQPKTFPTGIKAVCSPDNGTIECVLSMGYKAF